MTTTPLWFGPADRPLFGSLHVPEDGQARGAVVLCPPLGIEAVCVGRTYRTLSKRLETAGFAVLRFDYDGTGDSAGGDDDPGRVEAWLDSARSAVALLRAQGACWVALVGMRVGGTIAACEAARGETVDALVLWDPCVDGRSFLREQQILHAAASDVPVVTDGSVEAPGIVYRPETVRQLSALSIITTEGPLAGQVLVLARRDRRPSRGLRDRLAMAHVEWGDADGQAELLDVAPGWAKIPETAIDKITAWLSGRVGPDMEVMVAPRRDVATVGRVPGARTVGEQIMQIGPSGLFGIVTQRDEGHEGPTVLLLNAGVIDHVGPARLWVALARKWAAELGVRVVRFDLSGLGDSPPGLGQLADAVYPVEALDDMIMVARAVSPEDPSDVVLVGLCSGGYHGVEGGLALGARGVCMINPSLVASPAELHGSHADHDALDVDPRRQVASINKRWVRALTSRVALRPKLEKLPDATWWFANRLAVGHPAPEGLTRLVSQGVDTYIVSRSHDVRLFSRGEPWIMRRLMRSDLFHLEVVDGVDHELFTRAARDKITPLLTEHVRSRFAPASEPPFSERSVVAWEAPKESAQQKPAP